MERPRQKGHGDYATNVALRLAKQSGMPPRDFAALVAERLRLAVGIAGVDDRRPRFPQHHRRRRRAGHGRRRDRRRRGVVRRLRGGRQAEGERRVRLGEPDRSGHPRQRPVGGGRRHPVAAARGDRLPGRRGSTTSTTTAPRSTGSAGRCSPPRATSRRPTDGYPGQYIADDRGSGRRRPPGGSRLCPTTRRSRPSASTASRSCSPRSSSTLRDFRVPFDVYFHENDLYESGATDRALARLARARQRLRAGRRGLARAPRSTATTRTA